MGNLPVIKVCVVLTSSGAAVLVSRREANVRAFAVDHDRE